MPRIMTIGCDRCDYARTGSQSITVAILADGTEAVCPHPLERDAAEEVTGLDWRELVRQRRICYRYALVCLNCGELGYYGPDQVGQRPRRLTHVGNIVSSVTTREARRHRCQACDGGSNMFPLSVDETQWEVLLQFWNWMQGKPNGPVCPACHAGRLTSNMIAIS